jgi:hypothetical protein
MISLQLSSLMLTYCISITCVLHRRLNPLSEGALPPARWSLGVWGVPINVAAIAFSAYAFFWSFWPAQTPVDRQTMNYSIAIFGTVLVLALGMFVARGRKVYQGPVVGIKRM